MERVGGEGVMRITKAFTFEASHSLPKVPAGHKCASLHGHSWTLEVTVDGPVGDDGFVMDFADITAAVVPVLYMFDHNNLNSVIPNPTCELLCRYAFGLLSELPGLHSVTISETPTSRATLTR